MCTLIVQTLWKWREKSNQGPVDHRKPYSRAEWFPFKVMRHFCLYLGIPILVTEDNIFILRRAPGHLTFAVTQVCFRAQRETAWYGNAFRITRSLWWKCIGDRWIPPTNGQLCEDFMLFFVASLSCKRSELSVVWDAMTLMWHYCSGSWHLTL